jgi:hypothetical protein
MTTITERALIHAPLPAAPGLLAGFFAAHPAPTGTGSRLIFHAGNIETPAIVLVAPAHLPGEMTPRYTVHWEADGHAGFPVFQGVLTVEADEDYDAFWLRLAGWYTPPAGIIGAAFDAVVGKRLASETAHNLLAEIREAVEAVFRQQERSKIATTLAPSIEKGR